VKKLCPQLLSTWRLAGEKIQFIVHKINSNIVQIWKNVIEMKNIFTTERSTNDALAETFGLNIPLNYI
jgi:hypothetical protein